MGSQCSCTTLQKELRSNRNTDTKSPTASENRRFSIPQSPLRISEVFRYQPYERIDSKEFGNFDFTENEAGTLWDAKSSDDIPLNDDAHELIDRLISGFIRSTIEKDSDEIKLLSMIKNICYQYHNSYALFDHNDKTYICSTILNTFAEEKVLFDLLSDHWKAVTHRAPIIHLELLFRATRDGINNLKNICNQRSNESKILFVIQSDDNEIFGAFTSIPCTKQLPSKYYDKDAFLWNLKNKKIFGINREFINAENIFYHSEEDGVSIQFGKGPDLIIDEKCFTEDVSQCVVQSFDFKVDELIGPKTKNKHFKLKEIEIFTVYGL